MFPKDIKQSCVRKHKNVTLTNINGWGVGQAHFLTEDDEYLLLPWCYIISMVPSKNNKPFRNDVGASLNGEVLNKTNITQENLKNSKF